MRLIDKDALMKTLGITDMDCDKCAWCDKEWSRCKRGSDFEDACCAIENAPTIEERKWILCNWHTKEENLPQECKSVLICMKESYGCRIGVSYRTDYNRWEGFGRVNVIAWMPLPWIPLPGEARMENE